MRIGGAVLCGGRSSRMGTSKALLPFGEVAMLERVVQRLSEAVSPIVVVAAPGQPLPPLADEVILAEDRCEGQGPLEGIATGLESLTDLADAAYVTSCDAPLLQPAFVKVVIDRLSDCEMAVPCDEIRHYPLAAAYRTSVAAHCRRLLAEDRHRTAFLLELANVRSIPVDQLRPFDPQLLSLENVNDPEDYQRALGKANLK